MPDLLGSLPALVTLAERRIDLPDAAATDAFGARFARALLENRAARSAADGLAESGHIAAGPGTRPAHAGLQVQLWGDLGAGKTAFVRAVLRGFGFAGRVRSPTYTLLEPYSIVTAAAQFEVCHFDLYRFTEPTEWLDSGFDEYLQMNALCFIEWPQRAATLLGTPDLLIALETLGEGRRLLARAYSPTGKDCLNRC